MLVPLAQVNLIVNIISNVNCSPETELGYPKPPFSLRLPASQSPAPPAASISVANDHARNEAAYGRIAEGIDAGLGTAPSLKAYVRHVAAKPREESRVGGRNACEV